jgi:mono/diheme cytochrome c family protein
MSMTNRCSTTLRWVAGLAVVGLASLFATTSCKQTQSEAVNGQELFANTCTRCHGASGGGGLALWEGGPPPRDFGAHAFQDAITDEQIRLAIVNGKGAGMPPFGQTFNDAQLAALVAQIRSFDEGKKK